MDMPVTTLRNTSIDASRDRRMPRAQVQTMVVRQPVSLTPMGNTIALRVPAEMPFVGRNISVQTQVSGGMAKADPSMISRRLRGDFKGLSGLGELIRSKAMTMEKATEITMGDQTGLSQATIDEAQAIYDGRMLPFEEKPFDWKAAGDIFSTVTTAGANIYSKVEEAKKKPGGVTNVTNYAPSAAPKSNMMMYAVIGGVAVVGLVAFLMLRKKSAPAA